MQVAKINTQQVFGINLTTPIDINKLPKKTQGGINLARFILGLDKKHNDRTFILDIDKEYTLKQALMKHFNVWTLKINHSHGSTSYKGLDLAEKSRFAVAKEIVRHARSIAKPPRGKWFSDC